MDTIGRLLTAMVTPFTESGDVDYDQAKRLAKALVASGSDGVVVSGTTGESPTLSTDEKLRLFGEIKDALGDSGAVVAGTGNYNTAESIHLSRVAQSIGHGTSKEAEGQTTRFGVGKRILEKGLMQGRERIPAALIEAYIGILFELH